MIQKLAPKTLLNSVHWFCPEIESIELPIVAGGFIRAYYAGERPSDLDLYFRNEKDLNTVLAELQAKSWAVRFESDRAITLLKDNKMVQLIKFVYAEPAVIIENFDFTICCAALTMNKDGNGDLIGDVFLHDDYFEHLAGKLLIFQGSQFPLSSLKRSIKFIRRGYSICDENIIALSEAISQVVNWGDAASVEEHIAGMDPDGGRRIRVID